MEIMAKHYELINILIWLDQGELKLKVNGKFNQQ